MMWIGKETMDGENGENESDELTCIANQVKAKVTDY